MNLVQSFQKYIQQQNLFQPTDKILLAVSGGVDSVVLVELCKRAGYLFEIAHCNFQLREQDSDRDEIFVKELAQKYDVPFHLKKFDTIAEAKDKKLSIETVARELRYEWFAELMKSENSNFIPQVAGQSLKFVLTAHHANDSIETLMMNFFRGSGIKGLHGILPKQGKIIRPLLFAKKEELELFASNEKLEYVVDHTNAESDYTRNYFRNELIPGLKKVFPAVEQNLLNNIQRFKDIENLYEQSIALQQSKLLEKKGDEFQIAVLKLLKVKPLETIVYEIVKGFNFSPQQVPDIVNLLKSDSGKYVLSSTHRILRNRKHLLISTIKADQNTIVLIEAIDKSIAFEKGRLQIEIVTAEDFKMDTDPAVALLNATGVKYPLMLRKWKQGDYFYPLGMRKKKKLSRFFIDQKLSLKDKENTWLIESDKKIIWIVGMRIDDRFKVANTSKEILRIKFQADQLK